MEKENTGMVYNSDEARTLLTSASTTFLVADDNTLTMTKTADKENEYYFSGDQITFTITISNNGTVAINDLTFSDTLDEVIVPVSGTEYTVTTTSGTIASSANPITINNIDIPAGETVTIIIVGKIA